MRRSERISSQLSQTKTPLVHNNLQLPSPLTHQESTATESFRASTVTPPEGRPSQIQHRTPGSSPAAFSSPPADTQPFSQFVLPSQSLSHDVLDEEREGVWGYLVPIDVTFGETLVLRRRGACPLGDTRDELGRGGKELAKGKTELEGFKKEEENYEASKRQQGLPSRGYLIGRHPECGR